MNRACILFGFLVILILLLLYGLGYFDPVPPKTSQMIFAPKPKYRNLVDMTEGEKLQFVIDTYFGTDTGDTDAQVIKTKQQDVFIQSLPKDSKTCPDKYDRCAEWAAAGECEVNPEYMLYNCAKSCQACSLTDQQKSDLVGIYNSRPIKQCVIHSDLSNYPGNFPYLFKLYDYANPIISLEGNTT